MICTHEVNADKSVTIFAENRSVVTKTVQLLFRELQGYRCSLQENFAFANVPPGKHEVARLTPENHSSFRSYHYTYRHFDGTIFHKPPDADFVYLLPASAHTILRAMRIQSVSSANGENTDDSYFAIGFQYKEGDTICAARAGTVYACSDTVREGEKKGEVYKRERNHIRIESKDGSLCHYDILAPIQLLVTIGDKVIPGQPLAVLKGPGQKYEAYFSVAYLDDAKLKNLPGYPDSKKTVTVYDYIHPQFFIRETQHGEIPIAGNYYTVEQPLSVITHEMTKKEKKKLPEKNL
ncbi:MAG TPA: hypothetical protein VG842_02075 [Sediminibacterium sp.]|nr:hypothetical protein [Sediminibacterium sp.]